MEIGMGEVKGMSVVGEDRQERERWFFLVNEQSLLNFGFEFFYIGIKEFKGILSCVGSNYF